MEHTYPLIIGISAYAGAGKDTYARALIHTLSELTGANIKKFAFADAVKNECNQLFRSVNAKIEHKGQYLDFDAWTTDSEFKSKIRPALVEYGTHLCRAKDDDVWLKQTIKNIESWASSIDSELKIAVISDVRYPNEASIIQENGWKVVHLSRDGITAPNKEESINAPIIKKMANMDLNFPFATSDYEIMKFVVQNNPVGDFSNEDLAEAYKLSNSSDFKNFVIRYLSDINSPLINKKIVTKAGKGTVSDPNLLFDEKESIVKKCLAKYDRTKGARFSSYLGTALNNYIDADYRKQLKIRNHEVSNSDKIFKNESGKETGILDLNAITGTTPFTDFLLDEDCKYLDSALEVLKRHEDKRLYKVIEQRFLVTDKKSWQEIGDIVDVSHQGAINLNTKALKILKKELEKDMSDGYNSLKTTIV